MLCSQHACRLSVVGVFTSARAERRKERTRASKAFRWMTCRGPVLTGGYRQGRCTERKQHMDLHHSPERGAEKNLSDQFVEYIDLTDEDLEEIDVLEFGEAQGGNCGCGHCGCGRCGCGRCGCGHGCGCGRCGCGHGCGCGRCGCGHRCGCGRCGCGHCGAR